MAHFAHPGDCGGPEPVAGRGPPPGPGMPRGFLNGLHTAISTCFYALCCCSLLQDCFGGPPPPGPPGCQPMPPDPVGSPAPQRASRPPPWYSPPRTPDGVRFQAPELAPAAQPSYGRRTQEYYK